MKMVCCNSYIEADNPADLNCPECGDNPYIESSYVESFIDEVLGEQK